LQLSTSDIVISILKTVGRVRFAFEDKGSRVRRATGETKASCLVRRATSETNVSLRYVMQPNPLSFHPESLHPPQLDQDTFSTQLIYLLLLVS
jgi:hypothetical protein